MSGVGERKRQEAVGRCKSGKVERWTRMGDGCQVLGDGDRGEAVQMCKGGKVGVSRPVHSLLALKYTRKV